MDGGMGKDFNLVSYERKKEEIMRYIENPNANFKEFGYSSNAMPKFPLKPEEIRDVAEYVDSLQKFKKWMKNN
jgi:mono/diheme cytochrome c family protein